MRDRMSKREGTNKIWEGLEYVSQGTEKKLLGRVGERRKLKLKC